MFSLIECRFNIAIENAFSSGYHEFQIGPPFAALLLPVTKEYGNRHDPHACLEGVPEIELIRGSLSNFVTDWKRGERLLIVSGLRIGTNWTVL